MNIILLSGSSGMQKMADIMAEFNKRLDTIAGMKVTKTEDYSQGLNGLPKSDVLKFYYEDASDKKPVSGSVVVRPSGTEPKPRNQNVGMEDERK